jgi:hypothetical protein
MNRRIPHEFFSYFSAIVNKEQELKTTLIGSSSSSGPLLIDQGASGSSTHQEEVDEPQERRHSKGVMTEPAIPVADTLDIVIVSMLDESAEEDKAAREQIAMRKAYEEGELSGIEIAQSDVLTEFMIEMVEKIKDEPLPKFREDIDTNREYM